MWIRTSCWKAYPTQAFEAPKWAMLAGTREYCNSATITTFTPLVVHTWVFLLFILPLSFPKYCKRRALYFVIDTSPKLRFLLWYMNVKKTPPWSECKNKIYANTLLAKICIYLFYFLNLLHDIVLFPVSFQLDNTAFLLTIREHHIKNELFSFGRCHMQSSECSC